MAESAAAICTRALVMLGARPIASLDEAGMEARVCRELYPGVRDALLSAHPWSFATRQTRLPRLAEPPVADFAHAFQLPADFLRALAAGRDGRGEGARYRIVGRTLHADAEAVILTHIFRPRESEIPPFVTQALVARLAAELALPITESTSRAEMLAERADREVTRAQRVEAQQGVPPSLETFPLTAVRG